jgi:hypothetical protein
MTGNGGLSVKNKKRKAKQKKTKLELNNKKIIKHKIN